MTDQKPCEPGCVLSWATDDEKSPEFIDHVTGCPNAPQPAPEPQNGCGECRVCVRCALAQKSAFDALKAERDAAIQALSEEQTYIAAKRIGFRTAIKTENLRLHAEVARLTQIIQDLEDPHQAALDAARKGKP